MDPGFSMEDFGAKSQRSVIELQTYEKCPNEGNKELHFLGRQSRINRTLVVENANITFRVPFDDNMKVKLAIDIWGNGGWRPNGFVMEWSNGCTDLLAVLGEPGKALFNHMTLVGRINGNTTTESTEQIHPDYKCPVPVGVYHERNMDISLYSNMNAPRFIHGRWRMNVSFIRKRDKQLLGCIRRVLQVVYKNKKAT
ncbi:hypothetical protein LSTR_LSTR005882 [Laodelphax striatellus]|uniref:MD-2-related lipid-recognition domain-containing protein n=1 Tax=Laodelphax striatellus TaxID=195883 RepID=A0A482WS23_LAOST|nr:hypothetical protein LSTR_LSTR005882 [Laodelphax striatellus]